MDNIKNTINSIVATDIFGRKVSKTSVKRQNKYVGIFYFAWHNFDIPKEYDVTKILRDSPDDLWSMDPDNKVSPRAPYYFNEPLYGYYNSSDPWVIRKHIELFIAADIDFITYDFTNFVLYWEPLYTMLDLLNEYHEKGFKVPKVMFFTKKDCARQIPQLYENIYKKNLYPHLWFKAGGDKPYLIAVKEHISEELHNYFEIRYPFWPKDEFRPDGWPYVDFVRPQRLFDNLVTVSVSQHTGGAFSWSVKGPNGINRESWGRGNTIDNPVNGNVDRIERGENFKEQWDNAIKIDPEIIFLTGWNEWIAGKFIKAEESYGNVPFWVDTFNTEFSRDAEMTKSRKYVKDENGKYIEEGYGDNFYLQIIDNVRKYKGTFSEDNRSPVSKTINIHGDKDQWDDVISYVSLSSKHKERNFRGLSPSTVYTQALPDNIIKEIKITHDKDNLYFCIQTKDNITEHKEGMTNWMNLLLGIENCNKPSWESYHYVINRNISLNTTSLEKLSSDFNPVKVCDIDFLVKENIMQIVIPRSVIGVNDEKSSIYFKVADSVEKENDIMDYYVSGDSVPMGRLSYSYNLEK